MRPASLRRTLLLVALVVTGALAGCAEDAGAPPEMIRALADTRPMDWSPGNFWAYHATFGGNRSLDVALVVHEARPDGFRLGSNLSAGFFGLPFTGNVTRELNPRIGPETWPLYDFPLADRKEWTYSLFGYDAKTVARAALLHVPGQGNVPGFRLEASSYGQVFARYDYAPSVGWFTRFELIEPTNRSTLLEARLSAFGPDFGEAYFVETIREITIEYPAVPGSVAVRVPAGFSHVRATLTVESAAGAFTAQLVAKRQALATAEVVGKGVDVQRASVRPRGGATWTLEHRGGGSGVVHLEVTGLSASGPLAAAAASPPDSPHSTRPIWPQFWHRTSTG